MAIIGQQLLAPESGHRRVDTTDPNITLIGTWQLSPDGSYWGGSVPYTSEVNSSMRFNFTGTYLGLIGILVAGTERYTTNAEVYIDGTKVGSFSEDNGVSATIFEILNFETANLENKEHYVEIKTNVDGVNNIYFSLDAVDIDANAYLRPYTTTPNQTIKICRTLSEMKIGDIIPCRYTAATTSFSELGSCIMPEIPFGGSSSSDGLFFFRKVDVGLYIADRPVHHSATWGGLNNLKLVKGSPFRNQITPSSISHTFPDAYADYNIADLSKPTDVGSSCGFMLLSWDSGRNYVQFTLPISVKVSSISLLCYSAGGCEHVTKFTVTASDSSSFATETIIGKGNYATPGTFVDYPLNTDSEYKYYRVYVDEWYAGNGGDGQNIQRLYLFQDIGLIRMPTGGCAYANASGAKVLTNANLGGWPVNNEWDKYVVKSTLGGKITAGDDNVWHWKPGCATWCQDVILPGMNPSNPTTITDSSYRTLRGMMIYEGVSYGSTIKDVSTAGDGQGLYHLGFRPVLQVIEPLTKATTFWY